MKKLIIFIEVVIIILLVYVSMPDAEKESKHFIMLSTAYTPGVESCGIWADGFTFTGDVAGKGCIAIDPKAGILKLGQRVYVEGYGEGICNDIGEAIKGWRIDVCFDDLDEALEWGVKLVKVTILN